MRAALRTLGTVVRRFVALSPVLIAVATLPITLLALFNAGIVPALEAAVIGWLLLAPVSVILAWLVLDLSPVDLPDPLGERSVDLPALDAADDADPTADDPVAVLRERFARGEVDQAEFEERLDRLLATEEAVTDSRRSESAAGRSGRTDGRREGAAADRPDREPAERRRDRDPEPS